MQVGLRDPSVAADHAVQLVGGGGEGVRTPEELRHGPLHGHRGALCAAGYDVLDEGLDSVAREPGLRLRPVFLLGELQKHVDQVPRRGLASPSDRSLAVPPLLVLVEDLLEDLLEESGDGAIGHARRQRWSGVGRRAAQGCREAGGGVGVA